MKNSLFLGTTFSLCLLLSSCGGGNKDKTTTPDTTEKEPPAPAPIPVKDFAPDSLSAYYLKESVSVVNPTREQHYFFKNDNSCSFKEVSTGPKTDVLDEILMSDKEGVYETTGTYTYKKTGKTTATLSIVTNGTWTTKNNVVTPYSRSATFSLSFNDEVSIVASEKLQSSGGTKNGSRSLYFKLLKTL